MSDDIRSTLDMHFVRRMQNWVEYRNGGMGWGLSACNPVYLDYRDGYRTAGDVVLIGEGLDTDGTLERLHGDYGDPVRVYWLSDGASLRWIARKLGLTHNTAKSRIMMGHAMLATEFAMQAARWRLVQEINRLAVHLSPAMQNIRWPKLRGL